MSVYDSMGVVVKNPIVVLAISLPRPTTPGEYVIAGIYEPNAITDNVILVHLQNKNSTALTNPDNNFEAFILDLSNLSKIDFSNTIEVALYHDNTMASKDVETQVDNIIKNARAGTCNTMTLTGDGPPKTCGTGTIKP
ncbi:hypothetical protein [Flavobacterium sp.]|uniref:hypothetical protein n=1 Tax=Flavobacterium sp. TaxID=239 RepID=UPI00262BBA81|nr:hypothetical protein [Flavobacterium sp.]